MKKTEAYSRFILIVSRIDVILEKGIAGIDLDLKLFNKGSDMFKGVTGTPGRPKKDYKPDINVTKDEEGKLTSISMDLRSAYALKNIIVNARKSTEDIKNILYSILIPYLWSAFETYLTMILKEIFEKKIEILKSSEPLVKQVIIENLINIKEYLIEIELEKVEHFTLTNFLRYFDSKVNFKFKASKVSFLNDLYLLRNIIAHNTGIIKLQKRKKLNRNIKIIDNEIVISKTYFLYALKNVQSCVDLLENHIQERFFNKA